MIVEKKTMQYSIIPSFHHSTLPAFQVSIIPIFQLSILPVFHYSNLPTVLIPFPNQFFTNNENKFT